MSLNGEAWIKAEESDVSAPQEIIRMDCTLASVPNQGAVSTSCGCGDEVRVSFFPLSRLAKRLL